MAVGFPIDFSRRTRPRTLTLRSTVFCTLFLLGTILTSGCIAGRTPPDLLIAEERRAELRIGRAQAAAFGQCNVMLLAPEVQRQIQELADELAAAAGCELECRVHIVNSPLMNAITLPTGDMFVFAGLLDQIDNRDELAVALGHEIAHLRNHDGLSQLKESVRLQRSGAVTAAILGAIVAGAAGGAVGGAMSAVGPVGVSAAVYGPLVVNPTCDVVAKMAAKVPEILVQHSMNLALGRYSKEQELRADKLGMAYAQQAGYDPAAAIDLMKKYGAIKREQSLTSKP